MTFKICPSLSTVFCNSQELVTPDELALDLKDFFPRMLLPVALFPLPVRPTRTTVLIPLEGEVNSQSSSIALPPIIYYYQRKVQLRKQQITIQYYFIEKKKKKKKTYTGAYASVHGANGRRRSVTRGKEFVFGSALSTLPRKQPVPTTGKLAKSVARKPKSISPTKTTLSPPNTTRKSTTQPLPGISSTLQILPFINIPKSIMDSIMVGTILVVSQLTQLLYLKRKVQGPPIRIRIYVTSQ